MNRLNIRDLLQCCLLAYLATSTFPSFARVLRLFCVWFPSLRRFFKLGNDGIRFYMRPRNSPKTVKEIRNEKNRD